MVQKSDFIEESLVKETKSLHNHLKMNKLSLLNPKVVQYPQKEKER